MTYGSADPPPPPPSFALQHVRRCGAGGRAASASSASPTAPASAATAYATEVRLHVGVSSSASAVTPTASCASYTCPTYLLQAGCPTLRELLADAYEGTVAGVSGDAAAAASPSTSAGTPVTLPLPFIDPETFEVVAAYVEHFYAFDCTTDVSSPAAADDASAPSPSSRAPSVLQRPLHLPDLYALTAWEHHYVLTQLLGIETGLVTSLRLAEQGAWVDLLSGSAAAAAAAAAPTAAATAAATGAPSSGKEDQQRSACFAMPRRRRMWARLSRVLEAATRLGMPTLRRLCAAVAADMLIDLAAPDVARLVHTSDEVSAAAVAAVEGPALSGDARAQLLKRFPWLARP